MVTKLRCKNKNRCVTADTIKKENADVVIVATGALHYSSNPGSDDKTIYDPLDVGWNIPEGEI